MKAVGDFDKLQMQPGRGRLDRSVHFPISRGDASMSTEDSVSRWIDEIRLGKDELAGAIWERYFPQLVRVARQRLSSRQDLVADEEDIALSVLDSFFEGAQNNRFPNLTDRDGLWRLLSEMTRRKAIDYLRRGQRLKRGGGNVSGESAFTSPESSQNGIGQVAGDDPTPEFAIILAEACENLLDQLDAELQQIALNKLDGYTNKEIAGKLGCSVATVERRLKLIRKKWQRELT